MGSHGEAWGKDGAPSPAAGMGGSDGKCGDSKVKLTVCGLSSALRSCGGGVGWHWPSGVSVPDEILGPQVRTLISSLVPLRHSHTPHSENLACALRRPTPMGKARSLGVPCLATCFSCLASHQEN